MSAIQREQRTPARYATGMSDTAILSPQAIVAAVRRLGPNERLDVYLAVRETLPEFITGPRAEQDEVDPEPSEAFRQELEARYARFKADPGSSVSLEEFDAELRARFGED